MKNTSWQVGYAVSVGERVAYFPSEFSRLSILANGNIDDREQREILSLLGERDHVFSIVEIQVRKPELRSHKDLTIS